MNLKSHHRRMEIVRQMVRALLVLNTEPVFHTGANAPVEIFFFGSGLEQQQRLCRAIENHHADLDRDKLAQMVKAVWECDD
jgi:hypothetical protein